MRKVGFFSVLPLVVGLVSSAVADTGGSPNGLLASLENAPATSLAERSSGEIAVTEAEAKIWVLNAGYDQVSGLRRDENDFFVGTALLDGSTYAVVVDTAGNVLGLKE